MSVTSVQPLLIFFLTGNIKGKNLTVSGATEDEMVGWYHWLNGYEFEQTPGDSEDRGAWRSVVHGIAKSWTQLGNWTTTTNWLELLRKEQIWVTEMAFCMLGSFPHLPLSLELLLRTTVNGFWKMQKMSLWRQCGALAMQLQAWEEVGNDSCLLCIFGLLLLLFFKITGWCSLD